MRAFHRAPNPIKRDEIAARQLCGGYQGRSDIQAHQQGVHGGSRAADGSIRG